MNTFRVIITTFLKKEITEEIGSLLEIISMTAKAEIKIFESILRENGMCCGVHIAVRGQPASVSSVCLLWIPGTEIRHQAGWPGSWPDELSSHPGN